MEIDGVDHLVSQVPVLGESEDAVGAHLGTVMVAERVPSTWERLQGTSSYLLTYLGIALAVGLGGSWLLSRRIKRQTLGMEPARDRRPRRAPRGDAVRHRRRAWSRLIPSTGSPWSTRWRGSCSTCPSTRSVCARRPAHRGSAARRTGRREPRPRATDGIEPDDEVTAARDEVVIRRGRVLVMSTMRVSVSGGRVLGTVTTMRDRTALADLEQRDRVVPQHSAVLRAQAHEFANQLHTISGLIQIGELDEVVRYVDALSERRDALDLTVNTPRARPRRRRTPDGQGRDGQRASRRADDQRRDDPRATRGRGSADVATVVGNLVDNAIEHAPRGTASAPVGRACGSARTRAPSRSSCPTRARASRPRLVPEVFAHGFTTKACRPDGARHRPGPHPPGVPTAGRRGPASSARTASRRSSPGSASPTVEPNPLRRSRCLVIRVLVVDDDFMVARIHVGFVERVDGFEVVGVAHSAAEAADAVAAACGPTSSCSTSTSPTGSGSTCSPTCARCRHDVRRHRHHRREGGRRGAGSRSPGRRRLRAQAVRISPTSRSA